MRIYLPGRCELCKRALTPSERSLCQACFTRLLEDCLHNPVLCPSCNEKSSLLADGICPACHIGAAEPSPCQCLARYHDPWPELVRAIKFGHKEPLTQDLGRLLSLCLGPPQSGELVTWVPLSWRRFLQRGFNQAARLAKVYAAACETEASALLVRTRGTRAQARLGARGRQLNLGGAFALRPSLDVRGKKILIVDDVVTTGATTAACREALMAAGAGSVRVVSLCCG